MAKLNRMTRTEFSKKEPRLYQKLLKDLPQVLDELFPRQRLDGFWTLQRCKEDAKKYNTKGEWDAQSTGYSYAIKRGWVDECCSHMVVSLDDCKSEALRFTTCKAWASVSGTLYHIARRRGWVEQCTLHMDTIKSKSSLVGFRFGQLTVVSEDFGGGERLLTCRCACGGLKTYRMSLLKGGRRKTCGCSKIKKAA